MQGTTEWIGLVVPGMITSFMYGVAHFSVLKKFPDEIQVDCHMEVKVSRNWYFFNISMMVTLAGSLVACFLVGASGLKNVVPVLILVGIPFLLLIFGSIMYLIRLSRMSLKIDGPEMVILDKEKVVIKRDEIKYAYLSAGFIAVVMENGRREIIQICFDNMPFIYKWCKGG